VVVFDERMLLHATAPLDLIDGVRAGHHLERAVRILTIFHRLRAAGLLAPALTRLMPAVLADGGEVAAVHPAEHVARVAATDKRTAEEADADGGRDVLDGVRARRWHVRPRRAEDWAVAVDEPRDLFDWTIHPFEDTYAGPWTARVAALAAGGVVAAVDAVVTGAAANGFAIVRPPGHHCHTSGAGGFCFLNNIAIAARHAQRAHADRVRRVAIVDFDIHHGDGTQDVFLADPSVLFISLHRFSPGFYPGTDAGAAAVVGTGAGAGTTVNIPWPCADLGEVEYAVAFEYLVLPLLAEFGADLILVSAGFDAAEGDPLGGMHLRPSSYRHMASLLAAVDPPAGIVFALEGGYNVASIAADAEACVAALVAAGASSQRDLPRNPAARLTAPAAPPPLACAGPALAAMRAVVAAHAPYWACMRDLAANAWLELPTPPTTPSAPAIVFRVPLAALEAATVVTHEEAAAAARDIATGVEAGSVDVVAMVAAPSPAGTPGLDALLPQLPAWSWPDEMAAAAAESAAAAAAAGRSKKRGPRTSLETAVARPATAAAAAVGGAGSDTPSTGLETLMESLSLVATPPKQTAAAAPPPPTGSAGAGAATTPIVALPALLGPRGSASKAGTPVTSAPGSDGVRVTRRGAAAAAAAVGATGGESPAASSGSPAPPAAPTADVLWRPLGAGELRLEEDAAAGRRWLVIVDAAGREHLRVELAEPAGAGGAGARRAPRKRDGCLPDDGPAPLYTLEALAPAAMPLRVFSGLAAGAGRTASRVLTLGDGPQLAPLPLPSQRGGDDAAAGEWLGPAPLPACVAPVRAWRAGASAAMLPRFADGHNARMALRVACESKEALSELDVRLRATLLLRVAPPPAAAAAAASPEVAAVPAPVQSDSKPADAAPPAAAAAAAAAPAAAAAEGTAEDEVVGAGHRLPPGFTLVPATMAPLPDALGCDVALVVYSATTALPQAAGAPDDAGSCGTRVDAVASVASFIRQAGLGAEAVLRLPVAAPIWRMARHDATGTAATAVLSAPAPAIDAPFYVLAAAGATTPHQIASITKVMTFLVVVGIADAVAGDGLAAAPVAPGGTVAGVPASLLVPVPVSLRAAGVNRGTVAGVAEGEVYTVWDLLHGMMLPSGNDAATALAEYFGAWCAPAAADGWTALEPADHYEGVWEREDPLARFVEEMNRCAAALGMASTTFTSPHGMAHIRHTSTAVDVARLVAAAWADPRFRAVASTARYTCQVRCAPTAGGEEAAAGGAAGGAGAAAGGAGATTTTTTTEVARLPHLADDACSVDSAMLDTPAATPAATPALAGPAAAVEAGEGGAAAVAEGEGGTPAAESTPAAPVPGGTRSGKPRAAPLRKGAGAARSARSAAAARSATVAAAATDSAAGLLAAAQATRATARTTGCRTQFWTAGGAEASAVRDMRWSNTNDLLRAGTVRQLVVDGVKTGITPAAAGCLVTHAVGKTASELVVQPAAAGAPPLLDEFFVVNLGSASKASRFTDNRLLLEWARDALASIATLCPPSAAAGGGVVDAVVPAAAAAVPVVAVAAAAAAQATPEVVAAPVAAAPATPEVAAAPVAAAAPEAAAAAVSVASPAVPAAPVAVSPVVPEPASAGGAEPAVPVAVATTSEAPAPLVAPAPAAASNIAEAPVSPPESTCVVL